MGLITVAWGMVVSINELSPTHSSKSVVFRSINANQDIPRKRVTEGLPTNKTVPCRGLVVRSRTDNSMLQPALNWHRMPAL
jgi:hypothetical protein